ncbi:flagellar hook protein FlgE [Selenomonas ruminantium]|uniref:Flagellar hook protein FlgE n=1 Tax=Selenomonas ruminantium TaxID=971 RepID=A0A1I3F514_SELRU|nr:flagellar hook-basal body complex protein [Selenomonas ruminantium]SFI06329.1 flagellar hook protein FlgE [Selenomonas ruminantium]
MMRSLFSGVSGLKSHQTRMDVIGNNIANVNTTGFKSSRVTFADTLSQTQSGASAPAGNLGGTNPKQVGLGTGVASIDTLFTDGSTQSTGKNTDLAISGNALFVLKNGTQEYYTRNGAFQFDAEGNLVNANGMHVQGYIYKDGVSTGAMGDLQVGSDSKMPAKATTLGTYNGNLNASETAYDISSIIISYTDGTSETVSSYMPTETAAGTMSLTLTDGTVVTLDSTAGYDFQTGQSIAGKTLYTSPISSMTATATGTIDLTLGTGSSVYSITPATITGLTSGTYSVGGYYTLNATIDTNGVTTSGSGSGQTQLKVTDDKGTQYTINVPNPQNFTYQDGQSVSFSLPITQIDAKSGATVTTEAGASELHADKSWTTAGETYARVGQTGEMVQAISRSGTETHTFNGKTVDSVKVTTTDGTTLSSLKASSYANGGKFYTSNTTTVTVYDSEGGAHSIPVLITKTGDNKWGLTLKDGMSTTTITDPSGNTASVTITAKDLLFDTDGSYKSGSATLDITYESGLPANQSVSLNLEGMTQYSGSSTPNVTGDGNAYGTLSSVAIDNTGLITGTYSNGVKRSEGQVVLAQFNNAAGLTKTGNSLYQMSNNSGDRNYVTADGSSVTITANALEMSNVDIANEFSDMIITQRGFQSNSKIITVGDEMIETLINMKR